ncbi:MAG: serine/threonine-protein kinase [Planctomycetota bacterium]
MTDDRRDRPDDPKPVRPAGAVPQRPVVPVPAKPVAPVPAKPVAPVPVPAKPVVPAAAKPAPVPAKPAPAAAPAATTPAPVPAKPAAPVPAKPATPVVAKPAPNAAAAKGPDPFLGRTIGRCKILEKIGAGRTATVYRAHHEGLGTDVAVKILLPEILKFPEVVAKFEAEARAIARLDHPNVLKIYDVVGDGDARGIVMELLDGEDVLEYLAAEGGRVDPQDALRIVRQAMAGLQAAHAKGIIHRDVKPQNLVILEDGTVKVVDFGLATQANSSLAAERIGTPHYMAPEACEAKPVEPASDVYSLGISLYHLLTGSPPYAGQSVKEILASHVAAKPLQPEKAVKGLAAPLCDLVRGMTKRDPLMRTSADEVIATIDRIGGAELVAQVRLKPRKARHHRNAAARARANSAAPLILVGGAVLLAIVVLLLVKKGGGPAPSPTPNPATPSPVAGGGDPVPSTPPTPAPGGTEPAPATPPTPAVETAEQRAARKAAEAAAKQKEMEGEWEATLKFARENEADAAAVARKYRSFARSWPITDQGKEAKRRAEGIEKGEIHPHPEKKFAPKSEVETARAAWEVVRVQVEAAVETKRYDEALRLLPLTIEDPDRKLTQELELWRALLTSLTGFFAALEREVTTVPADRRVVETPKGKGVIQGFSSAGPQVKTDAGPMELRWSEVDAASVATLAQAAFNGEKKDEHLKEMLAAYAWAHRLRDPFYAAALAVKAAQLRGPGADLVSKLLQRKDRFAK